MSHVLTDGPSWGASSSAKLVSRSPGSPTRKTTSSAFEHTLRLPFEPQFRTMESAEEESATRPLDETIRPRLDTRQSRHSTRPHESYRHTHPPRRAHPPAEDRGTGHHQQPQLPVQPQRWSQDRLRASPRVPDQLEDPRRQSSGPFPRSPRTGSLNHRMGKCRKPETPFSRTTSSKGDDGHRQSIPRPRSSATGGQERTSSSLGVNGNPKPSQPVPNCRSDGPKELSSQLPVESEGLRRYTRAHTGSLSSSSNSSDKYIELSPVRRREIISRVNESVQHVMASMLSDTVNQSQWKFKLQKKDISYYTDETSVKPGQKRFCCVSHSHASVEDLMKLFVATDSENMARNYRVVSDNLHEARILSILRRPTPQQPMHSMFINYSSYHTPALMVDRETCVAVGTDIIYQPDGSVVGYCLWDTVDGPEFAEATHKFESAIMFRSGFFFRRAGPRQSSSSGDSDQCCTKIVHLVGLEPGGWAPGVTARRLMEKFGLSVSRLCAHFRRKQLDSRTFVLKAQWPSKYSVRSCRHCEKPFPVLSTRTNCHACGHVVCKVCVSKELVELPAVGLVPMHICYACLEKNGLPPPLAVQRPWAGTYQRRRLQSDTTSMAQVAVLQPQHSQSQPPPYQQSTSAVDCDLTGGEDEDSDTDTDTGEWAFTLSGVPVRPFRMVL